VTTTLAQPWLFAISTTVLVLETLVRGERFPGSIDPFSSCIPARSRALQHQLKTCPMTCQTVQAVIDTRRASATLG